MAIRPEPPNGGAIEVGDDTLRWSSLPQVDGYRIDLGTSSAAVAAAQPGAPEDRGVVRANSFTMDPVPDASPIFWRVDALRGNAFVPGTVSSFSVAPFRVTPREGDVIAPHGARPQRVTPAATNAEGEPVAWSASPASPWITLPRSSGGAGEPLLVHLNPAGLALGSHSGSLRVTGAGLTLEIPMVLQLFTVDLYRLRADPNRPVVYGLQAGQLNGLPGHIISIDATTGDYLSAIPLDEYATDFAIHPHEGRLYVPLSYYQRIHGFDWASGVELPSIPLDSAPYQIGSGPSEGSSLLGCRLYPDRRIGVAPKAITRLKHKVRGLREARQSLTSVETASAISTAFMGQMVGIFRAGRQGPFGMACKSWNQRANVQVAPLCIPSARTARLV